MKRFIRIISTAAILLVTLLYLCGCTAKSAEQEGTLPKNTDSTTTETETEAGTGTEIEVENDSEENAMKELNYVTKEELIEHFGYTTELDDMDIDTIVRHAGIEKGILENPQINAENLLDCLEREEMSMYYDEINIEYLFKGVKPDTPFPTDEIVKIALVIGENNCAEIWLIDLAKAMYYNNSPFGGYLDTRGVEDRFSADGIDQPQITKQISEEQIKTLLQAISDAKLYKWKDVYAGTNGDTTGDWSWCIGIEMADGTIFKWGGYGMFGKNKPENFEAVSDAIQGAAFS